MELHAYCCAWGLNLDRDDFKRRVHEATDIVRLVGEHVSLKPRGREFVGLCPFHDDKNPSMNVVPAKQIYHCFACGAGGDVFSFVMNYHKMAFPEAIKFLAERGGIPIPKYGGGSGGDPDAPSPRQRILEANKLALKFYRERFKHQDAGAAARQYVAERGIDEAMVEAFQIGYAPDAWDALSQAVAANRWDQAAFIQAGLIAKRQNADGCYDKLRHRLVFPILDNINRPIAFGGRTMPNPTIENNSDAKYLNSPETPLFNKSATLFGLHQAQKPIIDSRTAVIVEGYTDVIACHQAGIRNVVATLGTALTADHATLLRRYCDRVVLVFDGDEAGQKAADRALQVFFNETLDISIAVLPGGLDPAELLANDNGPAAWQSAIDSATDAMTFAFHRLAANFNTQDTMTGRQRITDDYLRNLVQLGLRQMDRGRYGLVFARLGELLGMSPAAVAEEVRKIPAPRTAQSPTVAPADTSSDAPAAPVNIDLSSGKNAFVIAERHILGCLLIRPAFFHATMPGGQPLSEAVVPGDFTDVAAHAVYAPLYEWMLDADAAGRALDQFHASDLRDALQDERLIRCAAQIQTEVDQLTAGNEAKLTALLHECTAALAGRRAADEYKQLQRPTADDDRAAWAQQALAHLRAKTPRGMDRPRLIG